MTPPRCRLLWQPHHDSCIDWVQQRPEEAAFFRRLVLHSIGQIELRHVRKLFTLPWKLFTIADSRRPLLERKSMGLAFLDLPRCRVPWGFARGLHTCRCDPAAPQISGMLGCVSSWICVSLHCVERLHAVNRRHADPRTVCCVLVPYTVFEVHGSSLGGLQNVLIAVRAMPPVEEASPVEESRPCVQRFTVAELRVGPCASGWCHGIG